MFIIDAIKTIFYTRKLIKYEQTCTFGDVSKHSITKDTGDEPKSKNNVETNPLFKGKEGLALALLLQAQGDESKTNDACDLIKALGLIDNYK